MAAGCRPRPSVLSQLRGFSYLMNCAAHYLVLGHAGDEEAGPARSRRA